jgi:hypothetical protein
VANYVIALTEERPLFSVPPGVTTTHGSAAAPSQMPAPAVPGQKMVKMETNIPETWIPGQKLVWISPIGQKVALNNPGPTQTLPKLFL